MDDILQDLSPDKVARAIEGNLVESVVAFNKLPGGILRRSADMTQLITGVPFSRFNGVFLARLSPNTVDKRISEVLSEFASLELPILWWIGPSTRPADLGNRLERSGFDFVETVPGLAADLQELNQPRRATPGLDITRVSDEESLRAWTGIFSQVLGPLGMPDFVLEKWIDIGPLFGMSPDSEWQRYIGWLDGEPVATLSVFFGSGVIGLYSATTIPEARGRGVCTNMTYTLMCQARDMGYRVAVLEAESTSLSLSKQLSFREYCSMHLYSWRAH